MGTGYHPLHVLLAPEGDAVPLLNRVEYVVGYLSDAGMARLDRRSPSAPATSFMLDVEGTPSFDLPDTSEYEGEVIDAVKDRWSMRLLAKQNVGRPCA